VVYVGAGVGGVHLGADAGCPVGDYWVRKCGDVNPAVEELLGQCCGLGGFTDHDGDDGVALPAEGETGGGH